MGTAPTQADRDCRVPGHGSTVNTMYLRGLRDYLVQRDVDVDEFWHCQGFRGKLLDEPRARIPAALFESLIVAAGKVTSDPYVGLHIGELIRPGNYGALGLTLMTCRTLREMLPRHQRYEHLVSDMGQVSYEARAQTMRLTWNTGNMRWDRSVYELTLGSWVTFVRWLMNRYAYPALVALPYSAPQCLNEYTRMFGTCPIIFNAPLLTLEFDLALLELPLAEANPELAELMQQQVESELQSLGSDELTRVRRAIMHLLSGADLSLCALASYLGLSERGLQRRLQEHGTSYREMLTSTRRTLAEQYIRDPRLSLSDVSLLLGFTDQSAFNRAFRQWTDETPGRYRRKVAGIDEPETP